MKRFEELNYEERQEIAELFATWLNQYTHEVITKVMTKSEEIINNEFAMNLLKELKVRTDKEREDLRYSMYNLLGAFDTFKEYNPHSHPLTHANSYRDILYDMYIR